MVKTHKRSKRTRIRGSRSMGTGFRKKKKGGVGNNGGQGMAGSLGQKQQFAQMHAKAHGFEKYFGTRGFTSASTEKKRNQQINLTDVKENFFEKEGQKIELKEHKILGDGEGFKAEIYALSASASATEKMEKAGGKIIVVEELGMKKNTPKKVVAKKEEKVTEKKAEAKPVKEKVVKEKAPKKVKEDKK